MAKSWLGNDNRTKRYQRAFVDSEHGVLVLYEGRLENKLLTLQKELELAQTHLLLRIQYTLVTEDRFTIESARSTDDGKTWDLTGRLTYNRVQN